MDSIKWTCGRCARLIEHDGVLRVSLDAMDRYESRVREEGVVGPLILWEALCWSCLGDEGSTYAIDIKEANTRSKLERWNEQLREKGWFFDTDWDYFLVDVLRRQT